MTTTRWLVSRIRIRARLVYMCLESVDIYKDYIVVGSPYVDKKGSVKGYAYIYKLSNFEWNQVAKLKTVNPTTLNRFGAQVQIDENVCIVKSIKSVDYINNNYQLHVFKKIDDATWYETDILAPSGDLITPFFAQDFDLYEQNIIVAAQNIPLIFIRHQKQLNFY